MRGVFSGQARPEAIVSWLIDGQGQMDGRFGIHTDFEDRLNVIYFADEQSAITTYLPKCLSYEYVP